MSLKLYVGWLDLGLMLMLTSLPYLDLGGQKGVPVRLGRSSRQIPGFSGRAFVTANLYIDSASALNLSIQTDNNASLLQSLKLTTRPINGKCNHSSRGRVVSSDKCSGASSR